MDTIEAANKETTTTEACHFVSSACRGETCALCRAPATHKVGEEIPYDEPKTELREGDKVYTVHLPRHPYTAYVCCEHFSQLMGTFVRENVCRLETP